MLACVRLSAISIRKAPTGQLSTQAPQSVQDSVTTAQSATTLIAPKAQLVSQMPQAVHFSLSIISIEKNSIVKVKLFFA
jgi:hypothetical protein